MPHLFLMIFYGIKICLLKTNLTRKDGESFFRIARGIPVIMQIKTYKLADANEALSDLRNGNIQGAAVLVMD